RARAAEAVEDLGHGSPPVAAEPGPAGAAVLVLVPAPGQRALAGALAAGDRVVGVRLEGHAGGAGRQGGGEELVGVDVAVVDQADRAADAALLLDRPQVRAQGGVRRDPDQAALEAVLQGDGDVQARRAGEDLAHHAGGAVLHLLVLDDLLAHAGLVDPVG